MPSPVTDPEPPLLPAPRKRLFWLWVVLGLCLGIPVLLTLVSALTSPPHAAGPPVGRLIYLDADQPSEKTTVLRGLAVMDTKGHIQQLLHETEPQDTDAGSREWITQPAASPDGRQIAFIKQIITLQEETNTIVSQLWVIPRAGTPPQPKMLLDLTTRKLKQPVGLAWTPDSRRVIFLEDALRYEVTAGPKPAVTQTKLNGCPPLKMTPDVSATHDPLWRSDGTLAYSAVTPTGPRLMLGERQIGIGPTDLFALSPDGTQLAILGDTATSIRILNLSGTAPLSLTAHWGWSIFGRRRITSLKWSPDGKYLAYTVSKPPVPEDELFYNDLATGKTSQFPLRTGHAAWDWTR